MQHLLTRIVDSLYSVVSTLDNLVWGWAMIVLLLGTHIFLTIRTKFIQYKTITKGIPLSVAKEEGADGEVSQFQALATALASTIGTDNIIKLREHPFIQSNECSHVQR